MTTSIYVQYKHTRFDRSAFSNPVQARFSDTRSTTRFILPSAVSLRSASMAGSLHIPELDRGETLLFPIDAVADEVFFSLLDDFACLNRAHDLRAAPINLGCLRSLALDRAAVGLQFKRRHASFESFTPLQ